MGSEGRLWAALAKVLAQGTEQSRQEGRAHKDWAEMTIKDERFRLERGGDKRETAEPQ